MTLISKRISAATLSLALGFTIAGAPMLAPVASAQISQNDVSSVDLTANASLTINKRFGDPVAAGDPENAPGDPLPGVQFRIERVDFDNELNTLAGWNDLMQLQETAGALDDLIAADENTGGKTTIDTITTGTDGSVSIDLAVGVYLVTELQAGNYTVAKPFLVSLPFTDSDGVWNYHQVVAPKNQVASVSKDVADAGATIGSTINYTARASVPADDLDRFVIIDNLPTALAAPQADAVEVSSPEGTPLAEGTDYSLTIAGQEVRIEFLEAGLENLETQRLTNPGLEVVVTFPAQIIDLPANGIIRNDIEVLLPNNGRVTTDPNDPDNPGEPEDGAETHLGSLTINKRDAAGELILNDSAKFELWRCQEQEQVLTLVGERLFASNSSDISGDPSSHRIDEFETVNGEITVYGVQVIDHVNGVAPTADESDKLCVIETEAPEGYVINPEPQEVTFVDPDNPEDFRMVVDVTNYEDTIIGQLPATGGKGTLALIAAGVLAAIAGGFAALRGNRARNS
ncbi:SpaH/EbpB family LPXTG-anchored major pilin [Corynebacterium sp. J010B-136]|uniref:SpaH/EbpB family LPXTG-anchored major pilin n=1 Tax=Corynebacterium sp. J010B-136 TaxID=2099401 RepID=UPI000CF901FE|nr:SpaH/EbpB family LPXTG-anchored major pilin [Corynebacterium sp. J010B-136]PQM74055.1 fimbrial assembly protein [Corynebacterium sp. J010B-136]